MTATVLATLRCGGSIAGEPCRAIVGQLEVENGVVYFRNFEVRSKQTAQNYGIPKMAAREPLDDLKISTRGTEGIEAECSKGRHQATIYLAQVLELHALAMAGKNTDKLTAPVWVRTVLFAPVTGNPLAVSYRSDEEPESVFRSLIGKGWRLKSEGEREPPGTPDEPVRGIVGQRL